MAEIRIVDVRDEATFALLPPCADPSFDHRTCDYWEDADRGSKAHRSSWLSASRPAAEPHIRPADVAVNPFAPPPRSGPAVNPFAFDDGENPLADNPFAPRAPKPQRIDSTAPRKLALLGRGLAVFGSYAKVLLLDDEPAAYAQFGPLSAYPRALRLRELYPQLPQTPLPAVITCVATTSAARGSGLGQRLIAAVCDDLSARGFAAVEAYPEAGAQADATSAATPELWVLAGFTKVVADERFPVMRRELE
jgi:GNAT superfamily N-acetyltransferase